MSRKQSQQKQQSTGPPLMTHEERLALINKPFPMVNIIPNHVGYYGHIPLKEFDKHHISKFFRLDEIDKDWGSR